jgi:hypothetical protein
MGTSLVHRVLHMTSRWAILARCALATAVLTLLTVASLHAQSPSVRLLLDSVSQANLSGHIQTLQRAGGHFSRVTFTPGNDSAVSYIHDAFRRIGGLTTVRLDTFYITQAVSPYDRQPQWNVVATLAGRTDPARQIVLGAHLDCSGSRNAGSTWNTQWASVRVPGADDNATGVAVILELARLLGTPSFGCLNDYTITFVAFGAEESVPPYAGKISHPGSKHYAAAAKARGDAILAMMSIDMIGYNRLYEYTNIVSNTASQAIGSTITAANQTYGIGLLTNAAPFATATFSDHAEFWSNGYPAICLIENNAPWDSHAYYAASQVYHTSADTFETLNMPLVRKVAQAVLGSVVSLAKITFSGVDDPLTVTPGMFALDQNYPNPFNGQTMIRYHVAERAGASTNATHAVRLTVHDVLGREVAILANETVPPGTHTVSFDARGLASGVYFYRLQVRPLNSVIGRDPGSPGGEFVATRRLLLLR